MMGESGPWDLHGLLDLSRCYLAPCPNQEEEHLKAGQMRESPESFHVGLIGMQFDSRKRNGCFHISNNIEALPTLSREIFAGHCGFLQV